MFRKQKEHKEIWRIVLIRVVGTIESVLKIDYVFRAYDIEHWDQSIETILADFPGFEFASCFHKGNL